jgi:hypothetical protein
MPGRSIDAIAIITMSMEKYREKQRGLHMVFIDLVKAYDRVPRQEDLICMREKGVPEKYVRLVQDAYKDVKTLVRCSTGGVYSESWAPPRISSYPLPLYTGNRYY